MADGISKAQEFALYAESQGWEVKRVVVDESKTVVASRGEESVTAEWIGNCAVGPIGNHTYPNGHAVVRNAASARRILANPAGNYPQPAARKGPVPGTPRGPRVRKPLKFDPYATTDEDLINIVKGHKVFWMNHYTEAEESGTVPKESKMTKIDNSRGEDTLGERILTFCDANGGGFRSLFIGAIVMVR